MAEVDQNTGEFEAEQVIENSELPEEQHEGRVEVEQQQVEQPIAAAEKKWPGWPGESVFRMLVPAHKVGGIIGRKGEFIKKIVEETRARVKILDGPPGTPERAVQCSNFKGNDSIINLIPILKNQSSRCRDHH